MRADRSVPKRSARELVVRVLDVGQGDAVLVQNGGSTVLIDGGPSAYALRRHLDEVGLRDTTVDAVILTHAHVDHYAGLAELFSARRRLVVRSFWENRDVSDNIGLTHLRRVVAARVAAGSLVYHDSDDRCSPSPAVCTILLDGGAKIHILHPDPAGTTANNRSLAVKIVGPDSASFTMWIAGDAEFEAIRWFVRAGYRRDPGMKVDVLRANHHGSCDGVSDLYLDLLRPRVVVASLSELNEYGHIHLQTKAMYQRHGIPWYRTDQNGTVVFRSAGVPGSGYSVSTERGGLGMSGPSDRQSARSECGSGR